MTVRFNVCVSCVTDKQFIMFVITSSQVFLGMKFSNAVKQKTCLSCRDTVLLNRLRIGHTRLTHSFLLSGDDLPECGTCQCPLTVKDIHSGRVC